MATAEPLLDVRDLRVSFRVFRGTLSVLDGVTLAVRPGERVGLIGETGCGKTTTLRAIMRILPREARVGGGQVLFAGRDVLSMNAGDLSAFRRKGASLVFQDPTAALNPVFTVGQLLDEVIKYSQGRAMPAKERRAVAAAALRDVALPDPARILNSYPFQLSGGMRQRVCIAMAIGVNRELILADEPGTSLDVTIQDQILRLISDLVAKRNVAVVLVTHSLGVVRETTDRVYVMYAGSIVESAPVKELFRAPLHPYTVALLECIPKLSGERISQGIPGSMPDYLHPPRGCRYQPRCPRAEEGCAAGRPPMREVAPGHSVACYRVAAQGGEDR
ncbi:MAG: ABC transporter ATP-binding protein [Bacillota bacterium]|nr:ABC transporter ATP-binding protein [Bacillota bacterium]